MKKEIIEILNKLFFIYFKKEDVLRLKEEIEGIVNSNVEIEEVTVEDYDYVDYNDIADGVMDLSSDSIEMVKIERKGWRIKNRDKIIEEIVKKYIEPEVPNDRYSNFLLTLIAISPLVIEKYVEDLPIELLNNIDEFEKKYLQGIERKSVVAETILKIRNIDLDVDEVEKKLAEIAEKERERREREEEERKQKIRERLLTEEKELVEKFLKLSKEVEEINRNLLRITKEFNDEGNLEKLVLFLLLKNRNIIYNKNIGFFEKESLIRNNLPPGIIMKHMRFGFNKGRRLIGVDIHIIKQLEVYYKAHISWISERVVVDLKERLTREEIKKLEKTVETISRLAEILLKNKEEIDKILKDLSSEEIEVLQDLA